MAKTIHQIIMETLSPFQLPVYPDFFGGDDDEYFTFNLVLDRTAVSGDGEPVELAAEYQIHYFCPLDKDYLSMQRAVRRALLNAGATYPEITDASIQDGGIRHLVFTCEFENDYDLADPDPETGDDTE